ncbi:MAG: 2-isopropylmalate synthase, partial [Hyphomonadaceae bacterium]|nr:2-isopropylmalate synthase [Clostridia bacterium]
VKDYSFVSYDEHALSSGSDSKAIAYINLQTPQGGNVFGVGISANINIASIRGILSAINRSLKNQ